MQDLDLTPYLQAGVYTDSDHPSVIAFAHQHTQADQDPLQKALAIYYAVRDGFRYNPYRVILQPELLKASHLLEKDNGYCIEKSNLMAAALRALGIPTRLGFANVRNHLSTAKIEAFLRTDVLAFHGYVEVWLDGRWVKATPVFDAALCDKLGVAPLDFNGQEDSIFQQSDKVGQPFMEYLHDHGTFADVPFELFRDTLRTYYPHIWEMKRVVVGQIHWEL